MIAGRSGRLLQVATVPILGPLREMSAFALILTDATEQMEAFRRSESLLQSYIIHVRRALASIRSSVELILDVPGLPPAKSHEFHRIIHREALAAGEATDRVAVEYAASTRPPGPLARMRAQDFLDAVRRKAVDRLGLTLQMEPAENALWIRLDGTSMALALVFILERLGAELGHTVLRCRLEAKERFVGIDFIWSGPPLRLETLRRWELQPVSVADEGLRSTLKDILARHRAELYSQSAGNTSESYLRLSAGVGGAGRCRSASAADHPGHRTAGLLRFRSLQPTGPVVRTGQPAARGAGLHRFRHRNDRTEPAGRRRDRGPGGGADRQRPPARVRML